MSDLSFRTTTGEGFSKAKIVAVRRIDLDYPDLALIKDPKTVDEGNP